VNDRPGVGIQSIGNLNRAVKEFVDLEGLAFALAVS
jgi:hypothetical protein